jgi:hypothetical protein
MLYSKDIVELNDYFERCLHNLNSGNKLDVEDVEKMLVKLKRILKWTNINECNITTAQRNLLNELLNDMLNILLPECDNCCKCDINNSAGAFDCGVKFCRDIVVEWNEHNRFFLVINVVELIHANSDVLLQESRSYELLSLICKII